MTKFSFLSQLFWSTFKTLTFCELFLTAEVELWAGAERVNDVDNEAMRWRSEWQRAGGYQQSDDMEQVGQMSGHVQRVVEGEHEHITGQDGDVIPHQVLLKGGGGRQARLIDDLTHPANHLRDIIKGFFIYITNMGFIWLELVTDES